RKQTTQYRGTCDLLKISVLVVILLAAAKPPFFMLKRQQNACIYSAKLPVIIINLAAITE
ncbi:hypothetical protein, partial [Salinivibrio kushneri]|uniref:hypothetical protein n=1 Tax=Salinivibrio kushneri TaxID=1908198 RepID=UPI0009CD4093